MRPHISYNRSRVPIAMALLIALTPAAFALCGESSPLAGSVDSLTLVAPCVRDATGHLKLKVLIVNNLSPVPVPLTDFSVTKRFGDHTVQTIRTDEAGLAEADLAAGDYSLDTVKPVPFKGLNYEWHTHFTITADQTLDLKISNADATTAPARVLGDELTIYKKCKDGVVTVEADFGQGSGFVIDKSGLILTNQHVVNGTHWVAVRFKPGVRVEASVVAQDKDADVAVIRVNPAAYKDMAVIPLAHPAAGEPLAVEGEKVVAIGSPLHQENVITSGIVSKVENGVLICDVNVNHGNSGGPLINMAGEAIGITTFLDSPTNNGPGISGVVAIDKAMAIVEAAQASSGQALPLSADLLPDVNPNPIPPSVLGSITGQDCKTLPTIKAPHNCETYFDTPLMAAARLAVAQERILTDEKRRQKRRGDKGDSTDPTEQPTPFWRAYTHPTDAIVEITVRPMPKANSASLWRNAIIGRYGAKVQYEYRDDVYDMELYRGGTLVQPVRRNRVPVRMLFETTAPYVGGTLAHDQAYGAVYFYDFSNFDPSQPLVLKVRRATDLTHWDEVPIDPKTQKAIWDQYGGYRTYLQSTTAAPGSGN